MPDSDTRPLKRIKLADTEAEVLEVPQDHKHDLFLDLPYELIETFFLDNKLLSRKDIIALSTLNRDHRLIYSPIMYSKIKLTWDEFKNFDETFKNKDLINSIRVFSDLKDSKKTNYGEWNISLSNLLQGCKNLDELVIETLCSSRFLKYQDKFDTSTSDKIKSLKLITHSSHPDDESLFELSQLKKFHNIAKLTLNGYLVTKDNYFYPEFKPDLSDFKERSKDAKLLKLDDLTLVNCKWEHPFSLSDIFAPNYPQPDMFRAIQHTLDFTAPSKLSICYSNNHTSFVTSERFKSFIDNSNDPMFLFQIQFFTNLKTLEFIVLNYDYEEHKYTYYYPHLYWINLKRTFHKILMTSHDLNNEDDNEESIITNLHNIKFVGWKLNNIQELDKIFERPVTKSGKRLKFNMKDVQIYLMRNGIYEHEDEIENSNIPIQQILTENAKLFLQRFKSKLESIFQDENSNNNYDVCRIEVGYVDECLKDGRYDHLFDKYE